MGNRFVIMQNNRLFYYTKFADIPTQFDHLIEFLPEIPPEPHTSEQHDEILLWGKRFQELMEIEHASSSKAR